MDLEGCVALVTGASGDIGGGHRQGPGSGGVSVAAAYLDERDRVGRVAAEMAGYGVQGWPIRLDQADRDSAEHERRLPPR